MSVVLDEYKGFCIDYNCSTTKPEPIITTGIDCFVEHNASFKEQIEETEDIPVQLQNNKSNKKSKQEKKLQKQQKKQRVTERKLRREHPNGSELPTPNHSFNPILTTNKIKKIYSKLQTKEETKLFQYESVALYSTDLDQLLPGEWINDNVISLIYEYLNQTYLQKFQKFIKLISPAVVQLMIYTEYEIITKSDFEKGKFIFMPVNETEDGDHWFLVVVNILENSMLVYDSMEGDSGSENQNLLNILATKLFKTGIIASRKLNILRMKTDQQSNFDDCGVYVIMISCYLTHMLLNQPINFDLSNIKYNALKGRLDVLEIIDDLNTQINKPSY
ncbi:cysteine proteinase [Yamadazyma tenuis]|uniref:Cysteine proteinase n=1 Tax=Candida tenuis (strain ATCC 10573 / BCRC 21748 / CBS 615 / JCM 9827 / NBRC 10315 / NRRL Y-1498 / VKM Y-70) TaxID=590646 RepID=G3B816_CANTC|nr:cysteine proteinase [Yamadazyma tenuis ATCC 10573]XP_006689030.1 uncharacterized protein CANTEDRAFT_115794 [Yamadazyma tenuis ATCC 10573]EGV62859.1 cysteine proteinase [Yamadazyma tenuis ATCC 10573]EGV62860.1 hypothetical protein CANTEDRAFT_115794 [Yamadazyma tenuis ATCC 10573]WEJ93592.1 cysteine proteinase [Yamadazyma tenuis]